jgi:hypothetical protein
MTDQQPASPRVEVKILVACDLAQISQDGKVSLVGIFERIQTDEIPIKIPRFFVVGIISGQPMSKHEVSFRLISPSGKASLNNQRVIAMLGYDGNANVFNDMAGILFPEYGHYELAMMVDGVVGKTTTIVIEEKKEEQSRTPHSKVVN